MQKQRLIDCLQQVDTFEHIYSIDNSEYMFGKKVFSGNSDFLEWRAAAKRYLLPICDDKTIEETITLLDSMDGRDVFNEEANFQILKSYIYIIIKEINSFFPMAQEPFSEERYGPFTEFLNKAEIAYSAGLAAGAFAYLRKIFETITMKIADTQPSIKYEQYDNGNPKNFYCLLKEVDTKCSIIPKEFSEDRYKLYQELSGVIHGDLKEEEGLEKYVPLRRLIIGIIENIRNREEFHDAKIALGWEDNSSNE